LPAGVQENKPPENPGEWEKQVHIVSFNSISINLRKITRKREHSYLIAFSDL